MTSPLESYRVLEHQYRDLLAQQRALLGSVLGPTREMEKLLAPLRQMNQLFHDDIVSKLGLGGGYALSPAVRDLLASQQSLSALIDRATTPTILAPVLAGVSSSETLIRLTETLGIRASQWDLLAGIPRVGGLAEIHLRMTEFDRLAELLSPSETVRRDLQQSLQGLTSSFAKLTEFLPSIEPAGEPPSVLSSVSTSEVLFASHLAATVTTDDSVECAGQLSSEVLQVAADETDARALLRQLNPDLVTLLDGADDARQSTNPDRVRHASTSLRELITHVLQILAPDDDVRGWSSDPIYFDKGRPTRRARLLFIVREVHAAPLDDFVEADVNAALEFISLFQEGTHAVRTGITDVQLLALQIRAEGLLRFLLTLGVRGRRSGSA